MKSSIVYFLGAGTSKAFGYPLTNELLVEILNRLKEYTLFKNHDGINDESILRLHDELSELLNRMWPGLSSIDLKNEKPLITDFLSLIDFMYMNNQAPYSEIGDFGSKRQLLVRALAELLEDYDLQRENEQERLLRERFIERIKKESETHHITIITTNYDLSMDSGFANAVPLSYGFPYRDVRGEINPGTITNAISLLKLHGSLNWLNCEVCGNTYINHAGSILFQAYRDTLDDQNTCHCDSVNGRKLREVIISPSMVRDIRDPNILQVWRAAVEALRTAETWTIIGYSLPAEDLAIRSIFIRARNGHKSKPHINVVQKGSNSLLNYECLFGPEGDSFTFHADGLEGWQKNTT